MLGHLLSKTKLCLPNFKKAKLRSSTAFLTIHDSDFLTSLKVTISIFLSSILPKSDPPFLLVSTCIGHSSRKSPHLPIPLRQPCNGCKSPVESIRIVQIPSAQFSLFLSNRLELIDCHKVVCQTRLDIVKMPAPAATTNGSSSLAPPMSADDNIQRFAPPSRPLSPPAAHTLFHEKTRCFV